jgi:polygalacturonase
MTTMSTIAAYNVRQHFGAAGDGETNATAQLQAAIDACGGAGGGTVRVPPGGYVTGTLWMRSGVTLHLDAGATLLGSQRVEDFPVWHSEWEGSAVKAGRAPLICGEGLRDVAITGPGTIDGRGQMWWDSHRRDPGKLRRPLLIRIVDSKNVRFEDVTLRNSPMWTLSPLACDDVVVRRIKIFSPSDSPNTDGINPDSCRNVRISDCHVDVGDDCITIKSGKEDEGRRTLRSCEDVHVSNCTLLHGHGGVVMGSEISGSIRNVTITNCTFRGTDRGIRIKARRGRGGVVEDIVATDLSMDAVLCPIVVNLFYGWGAWGQAKILDTHPYPVDATTPRVRRMAFRRINATSAKYAAAYVLGLPEMAVEDITLEDVDLALDPNNTEAGQPAMASVCAEHCRAGILARYTRRLTLRNVRVSNQLGPAVDVRDSTEFNEAT